MAHDVLVQRIRAEFLEMPGMRLTLEQTQRLCGIERAPCQVVLDVLVVEQFLCVTVDGRYARPTDATLQRPQPAKADLRRTARSVRIA